MLHCIVKDNGAGFQKAEAENNGHQSWSMKGLKERLEAYKQYYKRSTDFSIESSSGGTSVRIQFPLVKRV